MTDPTVPLIAAVDPNAPSTSKEMALVVRAAQDLQNRHLKTGELGRITELLRRSALNIREQFERMPDISSQDIYARAGALLKAVKQILKQSDLERKAFTAPILHLKEAVDSVFHASADAELHVVKVSIEAKMLAFAEQLAGERGATAPSAVESHGVKTQVRTRHRVVVENLRLATSWVLSLAQAAQVEGIISLNPRALEDFVKHVQGGKLEVAELPGLKVVEVDTIVNY